MSGPDDPDLQEVRDAYRGLPPTEPGASLDARVRAAVAAELGTGARVIAFPRWRRVALPLAAAATIVVAVGLWQLRATHDEGPVPGAAPESMVASVPVASDDKPEAPEPLAEVLQPPMRPMPPPKVAPARARRAESQLSAKMADAARDAAAPAATQAPAQDAARPADDLRLYVARAAAPPATAPSAGVAREPDAATFAQARQLLAARRVDEARALMARWRATHAGIAVPEDLRPLLPDTPR